MDLSSLSAQQLEGFRRRAGEKLRDEYGESDTIVIKDPRICRFYPFWREVLVESGYQPFVIIPVREPKEVAASLHERNNLRVDEALSLWRRHVEDAEIASRGQPRHILFWDDLLQDWRGVLDALRHNSDMRLFGNESEIDAFLTPAVSLHYRRELKPADDVSMVLFERMKTIAAQESSGASFKASVSHS
ncbi:hypothetical protein [Brevundimonas sp. SORGH_AS_0993]|uniref:hypothetical protein n=1 Tax=Brevundimonas sp. SORGH_AS_0993 TaxID=3041794 RepID=UPI0027D83957|nr:hypothetical protein [Brevundimonas sp. SORGH_AS_0993]